MTDFFPSNSPKLPRSENRHKKTAVTGWFLGDFWSAREDLNLRPPTPHDGDNVLQSALLKDLSCILA
ncbi:hypothetical protein CEP69_23740 [Citrobacter braakii]|nr:hypothetical protein CEP69_23740 [Citrobacter braakii]